MASATTAVTTATGKRRKNKSNRRKKLRRMLESRQLATPTLRFTPTARAKLEYLRDAGDTEIGGFGITSREDLLLVQDVRLVRQCCTPVTVKFDDEAVADFFDEQVDQGRQPEEFARIWVHTHPGDSAQPSLTDEQSFSRCFGRANWALMFILARFGETYARLRFNIGPGGSLVIPVAVDFTQPFAGSDHDAWFDEYATNVVDPEAPFDDMLDQRWEPTDLATVPDEFLNAWADYTGGGADFPDQYERPLETNELPD